MLERDNLKTLYRGKTKIESEIRRETSKYIELLGDSPGIYITDHAIVRYLERVKGYQLNKHLSDTDKLMRVSDHINLEELRKEILTIDEDREILRKMLPTYHKGDGILLIIKNLAVVTVIKK